MKIDRLGIFLYVSALALLCGCGKSDGAPELSAPPPSPGLISQQEPEDENSAVEMDELFSAVYTAVTERKDQLLLYDYLSQNLSDLFSDYDGGEHQKVRKGDNTLPGTTIVTDTVYYWYDKFGDAPPEAAASMLVTDMLEDISSRAETDFAYTLTAYAVSPSQPLYDRYDLLWRNVRALWHEGISRQELPQIVDTFFPIQAPDGSCSMRSEALPVALLDNMWIFVPSYRYSYKGLCNMYSDDERAPEDYGPDGLLSYTPPDDITEQYFLLIKFGDVWQMQNLSLPMQK